MGNVTFAVRQCRWILARCPCRGEEVIGGSWDETFAIPNGRAGWWYCPACQGWHVVIDNCQEGNDTPHVNSDRSDPDCNEYTPAPVMYSAKVSRPIRPTVGIIFIKKEKPEFLPEYLWAERAEMGGVTTSSEERG